MSTTTTTFHSSISQPNEEEDRKTLILNRKMITSKGGFQYSLLDNTGASVSFKEFFRGVQNSDNALLSVFIDALQSFQGDAFFWECPPVSESSLSTTPFEFVLIPAPVLTYQQPDRYTFAKHFHKCDASVNGGINVVTFDNLGGDSWLISPCPIPTNPALLFPHLAVFMRQASREHVELLWRTVTETFINALESTDNKLWLSTSGAGVAWLHVRVDSRPKYYQWQPYKNV
jgi:hypothetical protein